MEASTNDPRYKQKKLIEEIRERKMAFMDSLDALSYDQFIRLLSVELYEKSTHFLEELIQNADDCVYHSENPTLTFTYKKGSLRVDCNEVGFTPENVKAICSTTISTKKYTSNMTGEKGIGFKSVFNAADVVFISSQGFSFKFDQTETLGMITPTWAELPHPETELPGNTTFYLVLSEHFAEDDLVKALKDFDHRMLLFLRQLKEINIIITNENRSVTHEKKLRREHDSKEKISRVLLRPGDTEWEYAAIDHTFCPHPTEPKRPECKQSTVRLAFPMTSHELQKQYDSQSVYAYLPIKDYGFPFLLQGDFLLSTSRGGIDESSLWNRKIRDASIDAFTAAVDCFNSGSLKYYWPRYLPTGHFESFFNPVKEQIINKLCGKNVIESWADVMTTPPSLIHVSQKYTDESGIPFTLCKQTKETYLSLKYPSWEIDALHTLGVLEMSPEKFLQDLMHMIANEARIFRAKPNVWHSRLARVLVELATNEKDHREMISKMNLIPLRDGKKWVSAQKGKAFFAQNVNGPPIPNGINIQIVHPDAEADPIRYGLFSQLGVRPCNPSNVCEQILEMHAEEITTLTRSELLEHTLFIFKSSWQPRKTVKFWFSTQKKALCRGSKLYIAKQFEDRSATGRIVKILSKKFPFIHSDYLNALTAKRDEWLDWLDWLHQTFRLAYLPRLTSETSSDDQSSDDQFVLSDEFRYILQNCQPNDILLMLRSNWKYYSQWIEDDTKGEDTPTAGASKAQIRAALGKMEMRIRGRKKRIPLKNTLFPKVDPVVNKCSLVHTLDIPEPEMQKWAILANFDVAMKNDISYYLRALEHLHGSYPEKDTVAYIYGKIQKECAHNQDLVLKAFREQKLIYTISGSPTPPEMHWVGSEECIRGAYNIGAEYGDCADLFSLLLATGRGEIGVLVQTATLLNNAHNLNQFLQHFTKISQALKGRFHSIQKASEALQPLTARALFPVVTTEKDTGFDALSNVNKDSTWFIADRYDLRKSFLGKVPMLAFAVDDIEDIRNLLKALRLDSRRLSRLVKSHSEIRGRALYHAEYTAFLRHRASFISALIPRANPGKHDMITLIRGVKVSISKVETTYALTYGKDFYKGHPSDGKIASKIESKQLHVFMPIDVVDDMYPPSELVELIASHCAIKPTRHLLLQMTLSTMSDRNLMEEFRARGIRVEELPPKDLLELQEPRIRPRSLFKASSGDVSTEADPSIEPDLESDPDNDEFLRYFKGMSLPSQNAKTSSKLPFREAIQDKTGRLRLGIGPPANEKVIVKRLAANDSSYLGELMISRFFQEQFKGFYDPLKHWTSALRQRAGYVVSEDILGAETPFTIHEPAGSQLVVDFLVGLGYTVARTWTTSPTYRFELGVTAQDRSSEFLWSTSQLERMRRFRLDDSTGKDPTDIVILLRICNIYTKPELGILVDPWHFYTNEKFILSKEWSFKARIEDDTDRSISMDPSKHLWAKAPEFKTGRQEHGTGRSTRVAPSKRLRVDAPEFIPGQQRSLNSHRKTMGPILLKGSASDFYSYKPLKDKHIRLLYLLPGENGDILRGEIYHVYLMGAGQYRALSYVWGKPNSDAESRSGQCIHTVDGIIPIWPSLHSALKHIRNKNDPLILWVDALCINQEDTEEKAKQIPLLAQIFQLASSVITYLGDHPTLNNALETLLQIQAKEALKNSQEDWPKHLSEIPECWAQSSVPPVNDRVWLEITTLFEHPWFRRVWPIQEVVFASSVKVVCGDWVVDWNDLFHAVQIMHRESQRYEKLSSFHSIWNNFLVLADLREKEARKHRHGLLDLLELFRYSESTLMRDRLFALLNLSTDVDNKSLHPDYGENVRLEEIVKRYAHAFVEDGKVMHLLYRAGMSSKPERFPSWIPDWTKPKPDSLCSVYHRGMEHAISGPIRSDATCDPGSDELEISGRQIGAISCVSIEQEVPQEQENELENEQSLSGTLSHDTTVQNHQVQLWELQGRLEGWRSFTCLGESTVLAPPEAQEGDIVSILNGGAVPFLIRKSGSREGAFRLVGECFVSGIMEGGLERLLREKKEKIRLH